MCMLKLHEVHEKRATSTEKSDLAAARDCDLVRIADGILFPTACFLILLRHLLPPPPVPHSKAKAL